MPRFKKGSPEAKAWGEKMRAKRQTSKQTAKLEASRSAPEDIIGDKNDVSALLKRIEELEKGSFFQQPRQFVEAVKAITKYSVDTKDYPDPTERLTGEPRLAEHAFKQNFVLKWEVGRVQYSKDGVNYTEPKFRLELWRWLRDPDTNELTNKQYRIHKATFFEDPDAAIHAANSKGIEVDPNLEKTFLDEMRYLRMRDWLFEIFYPAPLKQQAGTREEIIGNRLVPVVEISSHQAVGIMDKL